MNEEDSRNEWLSELFETYYDDLVLYGLSLLRGQGDALGRAEEGAQEILYRAGKEYRKLRSHPKLEGWLFLTCRNLLCNKRAKYWRRNRHHIRSLDEEGSQEPSDPIDAIERFESEENCQEMLRAAYHVLLDSQRMIFDDLALHHLTMQEIAEKYSLPLSTVKSRIYRMRERLLEKLPELFMRLWLLILG